MFREINKILASYVMLPASYLVALTCVSEIPLLSFCSHVNITHNVFRYIPSSCIPYHARLKCIFSFLLYLRHIYFIKNFQTNETNADIPGGSFKCGGVALAIYDGLFAEPRPTNIIQGPINK